MDFNIFFDPEAASIMFQADFPNITVVGYTPETRNADCEGRVEL